jgi:glutamate 5-kinase
LSGYRFVHILNIEKEQTVVSSQAVTAVGQVRLPLRIVGEYISVQVKITSHLLMRK